VLGYSPENKLVSLRAGQNDMICLAQPVADTSFHSACYHKAMEPFMARGRALRAQGVKDPQVAKPFVPSFWKSATFKDASGKAIHTTLPWYTGGVLLTYNKDLLNKAGVDPAKPPTTLFGLFADYEKIAKAGKGKFYATMANPIWRIPADFDQMNIKTPAPMMARSNL